MRKLLRIFLSMLLVFSCFSISTNTVKADTTKGNTLTLNAKISGKCKEYVELAGKDLYSVAGAEYTVKDENNTVVGIFVIGEDGVGYVKGTTDKELTGLADGKYSIQLSKQPDDKAVFGLTDEGQIKYVTLTSNTPKPTTINVDTVAVLYGYNASGNTFQNNQYKLWRTTYGTGIFECGIAQVDSPCSIASFGSHSLNVADAHVLDRNSTTDAGFSAEMIYKIMYYGRSGPSQWSGFSGYKKPWMDYGSRESSGTTEALAAFVTHVALSRAWGRDRNKWSLQSNIAGSYSFWDYVSKAANAPEDFVVYVWEHSKVHSNEQDMFFGYTLAPTDYSSENVVMELMTDYDPVSVVLTKSGTSNEKIADAEFTMKYYNSFLENVAVGDETEPERTWVFKTDENGRFSYRDKYKVLGDNLFVNPTTNDPILLPGTYIVSETKVPSGYVKAEDFMIRVDTNIGNSVSYFAADGITPIDSNIENGYELTEYKEAYLNLHKSSLSELSNASLKGAVYNVYLDENCTVQAKINNSSENAVLTVGENGNSNTVALAPNKYYIKEVQEPRGYMLNETVYPVELVEKETITIEAEDEAILYKAAKIDVKGDYVENAVLQLYEGDNLLYEFTTTKEPTDISAYLYQGKTYHLHEKQVPKGYLKSDDVYFTVAAIKGEFVIVSMTDEFQPKIKTVATFEDGRKNNPVLDENLTVIDEITINDLVVDKTYVVKGFIYDTTDLDNSLDTYEKTFTAKNSEEKLQAEFMIMAEEGKDYVVYEYLYDTRDNMLASHTDPNDKDQTVSCPTITKVIVIKSDALDNTKHLKDCEITVFNKDGSIAVDAYGKDAVALTDKEGKVEFDIFFNEEGYYVQETKAPKGYRINKDKFEVSLESTLIEIKVNDMALPAVAFTGDIQYLSLIASVCVASALLAAVMIYKKKKALKQN